MPLIGDLFNFIFLGPVINLLVFILRMLEYLRIPGALGIAIILLTVMVRAILWPFISSQIRSAKKISELKPELLALQRKHGKDKQSYNQAQLALYKEKGINPASGCLPTLIQFPVIAALYQTIFAFVDKTHGLERINYFVYMPNWRLDHFPSTNFLGVNLTDKPSQFASVGYLIILVPVITALLQFMQSKMMAPKVVKLYPEDTKQEKLEKAESEDTMAAVQSQMTYMLPLVIGYISFTLPTGLAIYWNTFTILGIIQQYITAGWGGLSGWLKK